MKDDDQSVIARAALQLLSDRCPRLASLCFWAGTAAIASEELHHRQSFDLDFHTRKALLNTRPLLAELRKSFPGAFQVTQAPDEFGSGFQGVLTLPGGEKITLEVLSAYEDISDRDMIPMAGMAMKRVSLSKYLADKMQCVAERSEARDLVDILAVLKHSPELEEQARRAFAAQDAVLAAERLLNWTDEEIARDLAVYKDVSLAEAQKARDMLLMWLREIAAES